MKYTEEQIENYLREYIRSNKESIKKRLKFLLENYINEDQLISTDIWFFFEEARHSFMMGDYVASMIMCSATIERYLAKLLEEPYYAPTDEKSAIKSTGKRLIETARKKKIIDNDLKNKLLELNKMRNDFVHGIESYVHTRPQIKDPIRNVFMWTNKDVFREEVENNAKKAIMILFEAMKKLHHSRLNYY